MPKTILVSPNVDEFKRILTDLKVALTKEDSEEKLGISLSSLRNILNGKQVSKPIIETIAKRTSESFNKLVIAKREQLPREAEFYTSLKYGWFIANDEERSGEPAWFRESIEWENVQITAKSLRLKGSIKSGRTIKDHGSIDYKFQVRAERVGSQLFSMISEGQRMAPPDNQQKIETVFIAGFTTCVRLPKINALCGTWTGLTHVGTSAVYRYIITDAELPNMPETIKHICELSPLKIITNVDSFAL